MKTSRTQRFHRYARSRVTPRASGWSDWCIVDSFGNPLRHATLTTSGFEKSKGKAQALASSAARQYNETYVKPDVHRPEMSEIKPSCERKNYDDRND